jgi:RND superfamily putative drug exporter
VAGSDRRPRRRQRRSPLEWAGDLVTGHPRLLLGVWLVALGALALPGNSLVEKVSSSPIFVNGSEADHEHVVAAREFGSDSPLIVMLRGPQPDLARQGRVLAARLKAMPETLVNSPWDGGQSIAGLSPGPEIATLAVSVGRPAGQQSEDAIVAVEDEVERLVSGPVHASVAGGLPLGYAIRDTADEAAKTAELLAVPVLLLVLLFVCRSLIAAAMPILVGGLVVAATKGVLYLTSDLVTVTPIALSACGMLGLALGVDYALLVVSRFREELEDGDDTAAAVKRTVIATGHSVIPAGSGLVLAMLVASRLLPGSVISSVALAVTVASLLSVLSAIFATPAILLLLGPRRLDRWSLPRRKGDGLVLRWSQRLASRPGVVIGVGFVLFLCAAWAFTLQTHIGTVAELPPGNSTRVQNEEIQRTLGPGWFAPIEVVVDSEQGPVTTPSRVRALAAFQRKVEADPGIATMSGFASLKRGSEQLAKFGPGLKAQQRGIEKIGDGLAKVEKGAAASSSGIFAAKEGAQQLDSALGQTVTGSGQLADGLRRSTKGSEKLNGGLDRADTGSGKLAEGTTKSSDGAARIAKALGRAEERAGESASSSKVLENALSSGERSLGNVGATVKSSGEQVTAAQQALERMTVGRSDAQYAAAVTALNQASLELNGGGEEEEEAKAEAGIERVQDQFDLSQYLTARIAKNSSQSAEGIAKLAKASRRLDHGLQRLAASSEDLSGGIAKLAAGGGKLSPGLRKLSDGAQSLVGGLTEIGSGAGQLAGGLGRGAEGSTRLADALGKLSDGSQRLQGGGTGIDRLNEQSPGLLRSGYFFLASLDGSETKRRQQAGSLLNLDRGGSAARMLIIPRNDPNTGPAQEALARLQDEAGELAREVRAEVIVGSVTPAIIGLDTELRAQAPLTRIVLSLVTILVLLFVTRSLVLPLLAAALNLITLSATFGLVSLLFNGALLGGPGYVDTVTIPVAIILVFGLAIDYEVFIFARMREEYLLTGSASLAISDGLRHSASVVTGAALIMISVFLTFGSAPLASLRAFGVTLAIAVFIDAFVVRFVLLPATMKALGERSWWMPRWLDRVLPGGATPALAAGER